MKFIRQDAADLLVAVSLAGIVIMYMMDAYSTSSRVNNLLLIFPIGVIALCFLAGILVQIGTRVFNSSKSDESGKGQPKAMDEKGNERMIFLAMLMLALYVFAISELGFDIATFLFIGLMLFLQGERRLTWLIGFPLVFSILVSQFFTAMIPYPMPMAIQLDWIPGLI